MPKINKVVNLVQSAGKSLIWIALGLFISVIFSSFSVKEPQVDTATIERQVLRYSNDFRKSVRHNQLTRQKKLDEIARKHAQDMAYGRRRFSHNGFNSRFKEAGRDIRGAYSFAENLYTSTNYSSEEVAQSAVKGWKTSKGHLRNLKGSFDYTGIGVVRNRKGDYYVVQVYMKVD